MGLKMSRLALARWVFGAGLALTLVGAAWMVSVGPYAVIPGIVLLVAGVALAPRRRQ